ncbi:MAG: peptidylprolyl isomerase [Bacteroidetes bacterium HGW-Bacteroidetes-6]|jgi:peptidyl-prolyl cis-trans isomerase SurA|nr:MAG: peptidylprolyl isomerase [Bacteroidetes bacterium HGW-Bacteroidetes-6]
MRKITLFIAICLALQLSSIAQPEGETVDKIVAIVGSKMILLSEVETQYWQMVMQGEKPTDELRCSILEELMLQKMLLNQAEIDSLQVSESQVDAEIERRIRYFVAQFGSPEALEKYYNKSIVEIKDEFKDLIREQMLIQMMQGKITENVTISPSEVKQYFNGLSPDSIPYVESDLEIGQIVIIPQATDADKLIIYDKLAALRERILKGESFEAMARLYSEDPGSAKKGGELGMFSRGQMFPEFEAAAFGLKNPGDISEIIETPAGYHFLQLIERKGDYINVRHILLIVKASPTDLYNSKKQLDDIYAQISSGAISFEEASEKYNPDEYKSNNGLIVNAYSGNTRFKSDEVDATVFFTVDKLEPGNISKPVLFQTDEGKEGYRLLYLKSRTTPHKATLENDYNVIMQHALNTKKTQALEKWVKEKKSITYVRVNDDYKGCLFNFNWE